MSNVLPFVTPIVRKRPDESEKDRFSQFLNDAQVLIGESPRQFATIASLLHGLADKQRRRLAKMPRSEQSQ